MLLINNNINLFLRELYARIMNNNDLHGKIPDQLTNCFSLTSLWVRLSASLLPLLVFTLLPIVTLFEPFSVLFFFFSCFRNLSYNNLSGVIPSMKNFSRFSADRYCKQALWFYCFWSSMYQWHWHMRHFTASLEILCYVEIG